MSGRHYWSKLHPAKYGGRFAGPVRFRSFRGYHYGLRRRRQGCHEFGYQPEGKY